jgi:hypothetical protein
MGGHIPSPGALGLDIFFLPYHTWALTAFKNILACEPRGCQEGPRNLRETKRAFLRHSGKRLSKQVIETQRANFRDRPPPIGYQELVNFTTEAWIVKEQAAHINAPKIVDHHKELVGSRKIGCPDFG